MDPYYFQLLDSDPDIKTTIYFETVLFRHQSDMYYGNFVSVVLVVLNYAVRLQIF
jgi:hypothetical protein